MPLLWFSCDNSAIFAPWEMIRLIQFVRNFGPGRSAPNYELYYVIDKLCLKKDLIEKKTI
jgi:hypothetical protein